MRAWHSAALLLCCLFALPAVANSDEDGDGVPDFKDACPATPAGIAVSANGCAAEAASSDSAQAGSATALCMLTDHQMPYPADCSGAEVPKVYFEFASAYVSMESSALLARVAEQLKGQMVTIVLRGHTDIIGTSEANWHLSRERAENVAAVLSGDFGIERQRILLESFGASEPVASNETPMGRQQNRRVEILIHIE